MTSLKIYLFSFLALLLTFCSSCDEDAFSTVVDIEIPEHQSALAVSSAIHTQDSVWRVLVSKSEPIVGESTITIIEDATVDILKNGNPFMTLPFNSATNHYEIPLAAPLEADDSVYKIAVSAATFDAVSAEQTMPRSAIIENISFEADGTIDSYGYQTDELSFDIVDQAGADYYGIELFYVYSFDIGNGEFEEGIDQLYMETSDVLIEDLDFGRSKVISDASFDGNKYRVRLTTNLYSFDDLENKKLVVRINSLTRESYLFQRSLHEFRNSQDNPFAEPVIVFDNIENGHGIFRMENRSVFELEL